MCLVDDGSIQELSFERGGPGVFSFDLRDHHILSREEWRYDHRPEFWDGKNITDFVDADVLAKVEALEREEVRVVVCVRKEV